MRYKSRCLITIWILCFPSFPVLVQAQGDVLNCLFLICTFGLGGVINNCIARPKCEDGLMDLGVFDEEYCGCIADVEDGPFCVKGVAGCSSRGIFCIQDDLCGDANMAMTFGDNGELDTTTELYSYFLATTPAVYELRIIAQPNPNDNTRFASCQATLDSTKQCQSCRICDNGISFAFDCSDQTVNNGGGDVVGPVVSECLNFLFEKI